jgi:hypothetical protein
MARAVESKIRFLSGLIIWLRFFVKEVMLQSADRNTKASP